MNNYILHIYIHIYYTRFYVYNTYIMYLLIVIKEISEY